MFRRAATVFSVWWFCGSKSFVLVVLFFCLFLLFVCFVCLFVCWLVGWLVCLLVCNASFFGMWIYCNFLFAI